MTDTTKTEPLGDWWNRPDEHLGLDETMGETLEIAQIVTPVHPAGFSVRFRNGSGFWFTDDGVARGAYHRIIRKPDAPTADAAIEQAVHDTVEQVGMPPVFAPTPSTVTPWDLFAAGALAGFCSLAHDDGEPIMGAGDTAKAAANYADAMMAERAKRGVA